MVNLKLVFAKLKIIVPVAAMSLASSNLYALGLGSLDVQSNLDQPFNGVIELRVAQGDDLSSVVATIASQEDFENLNIDYPAYLSDMTLDVESVGGSNVLRISSSDVVIKEPFIHFLVRVDWSGGSFLREYTALIDPPVYASETPKALSQPRVVGSDQSRAAQPVVENEVVTQPARQVEETPTYVETQARNTNTSSQAAATDAQYGPVNSGETLSEIANDLQRQFPDLSIYQIMKVLFDENQGAFIGGNINGLMEGVVLNVANLDTIRSVDVSDSKEFFYDQVVEWDPSSLLAGTDSAVKVGQDEYLYNDDDLFQDDGTSSFSTESSDQDDTFQVGSSSDTESFVSATQGDNREGEVIALQQQVTDLQTSLSSSSLENQELKERISILEGQLADMNRLMSLSVEDADLATLEADLASQNNADGLTEEAGIDSVLEEVGDDLLAEGLVDESVDTLAEDSLLAEDTLLTDDDSLLVDDSLLADDSLSSDGILEDGFSTEGSVIEEVDEEIVEAEETTTPAVVSLSSKPSLVENIKSSVVDSGLWKIIAGVGAVIAAGLALFFLRRRRADEEFEVSMMTIESHDTETVTRSKTTVSASTHSTVASESKSVTVAATAVADNEETSFLTVYSDSDAVVQADEVDPIAEADVYIAYGRDEQAEEVLLDGIASQPERVDIKHKLLTLYHKNSNSEGFERVSEELYAQKDLMDNTDVWQEISVMGKELLPDNPMFELSASDLFVDSQLDTELESSKLDIDNVVEDAVEGVEQEIDDAADSLEDKLVEFAQDDSEVVAVSDSDESEENDDEDSESIHLVNFKEEDDDESDDVRVSALEIDDETDDDEVVEIDLEDVVDFSSESDDDDSSDDDDEGFVEETSVSEVSDLDIDEDYDEARTQYELAKVFVDLGDEDGARKILNDIVDNRSNGADVVSDATELLESIGS